MQITHNIEVGTDERTSSDFKYWARYPDGASSVEVHKWLSNRFGNSRTVYTANEIIAENENARWTSGLSYIWFKNLSDRMMFILYWS